MNKTALSVLFLLTGCAHEASAPVYPVATQSASLTSAPAAAAPAEPAAETKAPVADMPAAPAAPGTSVEELDPLARLGTKHLPKIDFTAKKELKKKSRADLNAALSAGQQASTVEDAVKAMEKRAGKPTWVEENGKSRVWIVTEGQKCHRLSLDNGGEINLEVSPVTEWHMLAVGARQNVCTGEIRAGIVGGE